MIFVVFKKSKQYFLEFKKSTILLRFLEYYKYTEENMDPFERPPSGMG
jgi:hypothetical protein